MLSEDLPPPFGLFLARDILRFNLSSVGHRVLIFPLLNASSVLTRTAISIRESAVRIPETNSLDLWFLADGCYFLEP